MFLCHFTDLINLQKILEDNQLKSNAQTKNINKGDGIYKAPNHFVYFTFCRELFRAFNIYDFVFKTVHTTVILYFNPSFLREKSFYLSSLYTPNPTEEGTFTLEDGKKVVKKSYPRDTTNIERILKRFYINNDFVFLEGQVAVRNSVKLKDNLVAIEFKNCDPPASLVSFVKKDFPNVEIKVTHTFFAKERKGFLEELKFVNATS